MTPPKKKPEQDTMGPATITNGGLSLSDGKGHKLKVSYKLAMGIAFLACGLGGGGVYGARVLGSNGEDAEATKAISLVREKADRNCDKIEANQKLVEVQIGHVREDIKNLKQQMERNDTIQRADNNELKQMIRDLKKP